MNESVNDLKERNTDSYLLERAAWTYFTPNDTTEVTAQTRVRFLIFR